MKTNLTSSLKAPVPMTVRDASRIYSATAKQNQGEILHDSFAARAMAAATRNAAGDNTQTKS